MEIVMRKVSELTPYEKNAKTHDKRQIDNVAQSIKELGWLQPLVVDKDGVVVVGHCRLLAAKKLKQKEVPCLIADDLTDEQIKKYRVLDNKLNESPWDLGLLAEDIEGLDFDGFDLDFGIDGEVVGITSDDVVEDDFDVNPPEKPKAKLGDIYQLGEHRLMCGSSTNIHDVEKLMNGNKAKVLFTSPPYSDMREYEGGKNLDVDNIATFIAVYRLFTDYQCVNLGIQRKEHAIVPYWDEYIKIAQESGYKLMAWNIWDKQKCGSIGQQSAFFPIRHEWIFVFGTEFFEINATWEKKEVSIGVRGPRAVRQKDGSMKTSSCGDTTGKYKQMESVLPLFSELSSVRALHPAVFPVALPAEYIQAMTDKDDIVIEPFCGSGTTLIACEQLGRKCYGMELEPKYVDVIVERWENLTGKKAVLLNG